MTVSSTTSRVSYSGNGSTTAFTVPFPFLANADLVVIRVVGTVQTTLTLSTDYTVTGAGGVSGTVTCTVAPAAGSTLVIYRDPTVTQLVDYTPNDPFPANTHETALDRLTMIAQRQKDLVTRSMRLSDGDVSGASTTLPTPEANKVIGWDSGGTSLTNIDGNLFASVVAFATAKADTFTGNGSTTAFTLTANPGTIANLDVSVSGLTKVPVTDYTWNGTTVTFTVAPSAAAPILIRYMQGLPASYGSPINITVGAGTAAMTLSDGTRSLTYTPNTTAVLNHVGALNISIGGTATMQFSTNRNVTIPAPASGIALSVASASGVAVAATATAGNGAIISAAGNASIPASGSVDIVQDGSNQGYLYNRANAALLLGTNNTTRVNIGSAGNTVFAGSAATTPVAVTFSATAMTVNCALSNVFATTFTANVTTAPSLTNASDGQTINWFITQDATGSRTMTWPTSFKWPGGSAGVLSTAANSVDLLVATYRSATGFWYCSLQKAFA